MNLFILSNQQQITTTSEILEARKPQSLPTMTQRYQWLPTDNLQKQEAKVIVFLRGGLHITDSVFKRKITGTRGKVDIRKPGTSIMINYKSKGPAKHENNELEKFKRKRKTQKI
jgi:hypothetical protein